MYSLKTPSKVHAKKYRAQIVAHTPHKPSATTEQQQHSTSLLHPCLSNFLFFSLLSTTDPAEACLDGKSLDLVAKSLDLASKLTRLVGVDRGSNHGATNTAGTAEHVLARDVDVGSTLVFAQEGDVQKNGEGLGVGGENGDFAGSAVQGLGDFVGTLLGLADVRGRLQKIEDLLSKGGISQRPGCRKEVS